MSIRVPNKSGSSPGGARVLVKKDITDMEASGVKLRRQMDVHVTCLEARSSSKVELVQEWHEYLKKRSEIEAEYAKSLDKLSDRTLERIGRVKKSSAKENINPCSNTAVDLLHTIVTDNKTLAARRLIFCDDVTNEVLPRLDVVAKDINVATRRVKDGFHFIQEDIKKAHLELLESMKSYMAACQASEESQSKLSKIQSSRSKGKNVDKDAKKEIKMLEGLMSNKTKAITCRNEYVMCLQWFNKVCNLYFRRWSADLLEFLDFDFHAAIQKIQKFHGGLESNFLNLQRQCIVGWNGQLPELSAKADLRKFQSANLGAFPIPGEVPFLPYSVHEKNELHAVLGVFESMNSHKNELSVHIGLASTRLEEAYRHLQDMKESFSKAQESIFDTSISGCLEDCGSKTLNEKQKTRTHMTSALSSVLTSRRENHDSLCSAFNKVMENIAELSKSYTLSDMLEEYMADLSTATVKKNTQALATESLKADEDSKHPMSHLDKYMMSNNNRIPPIITSCIRFIEQHGPTVEGVFRVPGIVSQIEEMREQFIDEDKDPLYGPDERGKTYDIHAVGSLLKQYLRDLPEPVFPFSVFQAIVDVQTNIEKDEKIGRLTEIMKDLPPNRMIVLREIMSFLDKFSEHSAATKMNTNNLALVFGPTLLAAPADMDAITLAQHTTAVNLVTLLMVENRLAIFGESEPIVDAEADECSAAENAPTLSRQEKRRLTESLHNLLEESLLHSLFSAAELAAADEDVSRRAVSAAARTSIGNFTEDQPTPEISLTPSAPSSVCATPSAQAPPSVPASVGGSQASSPSPHGAGVSIVPGGGVNVSAAAIMKRRGSLRTAGLLENDGSSPSSLPSSTTRPSQPSLPERTRQHTNSESEESGEAKQEKKDYHSRFNRTQSVMAHANVQSALARAMSSGDGLAVQKKRASVPSIGVSPSASSERVGGRNSVGGGQNTAVHGGILAEQLRKMPEEQTEEDVTANNDDNIGSQPQTPTSAAEPKTASMGPPAPGSTTTSPSSSSTSSLQQVKASHAYTARTAKELSFTKGAVIDVFAKSPDGNWWDSMIDGKRGYIPASYVKLM